MAGEDKPQCSCAAKPRPEECTPEQIRRCHGKVASHPCEGQAKEQSGN